MTLKITDSINTDNGQSLITTSFVSGDNGDISGNHSITDITPHQKTKEI